MRTIITAVNAYFFVNAVVALTPQSPYYGKGKGNIFDNELVFAKVNSYPITYTTGETGLELKLFQKIGSVEGSGAALIDTHLKDEIGGLNMRLARMEEVNKLKSLLEKNEIELGYYNKKEALEALEALNNYVDTGVPRYLYLDSVDGGNEIYSPNEAKTALNSFVTVFDGEYGKFDMQPLGEN